jgi:hypothetical protein
MNYSVEGSRETNKLWQDDGKNNENNNCESVL